LNNDSILYGGHTLENETKIIRKNLKQKKINISYKNNDIRFYYATPYFIEPKYTLYRVKLENHDKNWSLWSRETKKDYTNLSPGNYIFLVEAKNIYNQISETTKIKILIKYPWYRTIYAYIFYWLVFMGFFWLTVKLVTYRLKRKNEKLEAIVEERTKEIKLKNSELEQQKEEIMTQAEELFIVNTELEKLSTIVRETDNAIILADKNGNFIWINQAFTKIFGYTFEELVNNISTNIIADRTDKNIKDTVNKCLTDKVTVEYELKIKNKSGKDIWIHTTLTPLLDEDGEITSLVAIDSDISILKEAQKQITEQNEYIKSSIKYALTIQKSILPSEKEISDFFDNFIIFKPKDIVSGDFYWISNLFVTDKCRLTHDTTEPISFKVGNTLFFAVVDCTGHGVSGAFMSLIGNRLLAELINERRIDSPKDILYKLDTKLGAVLKRNNKSNHDSMVLSICRFDKYLENDTEFVKVTSAGAKQHFTYFSRQLKEFVRIRGSVRQIGFVVNESLIYDNSEFVLQKGDTLFLYTDGLKDLNNSERKSFGHSRIIDILKESINKPMPEIGDILEVSLNEWLGTELQRDDVTFVGLRMK
jgi:PAS domain S-box-containing protein